jgi:hypothetical protein
MDNQKINKQKALVALFLLFTYSIILISLAQTQGQEDLVLTLRQNPSFIFFLLFPICMWIFFVIKGNNRIALINFLKNDLLNYISKFMAFIITAYLTYFVLIPHKNEDFIDVIIKLVLSLTAFVLFLFACWFEESKNPSVNRDNLKSFTKTILKVGASLIIPVISFFFIHHFLLSLNTTSSLLLGLFQVTLLMASLSPIFKSRLKKYITVILFLLIQSGLIIWMSKVRQFNILKQQLYWILFIEVIIIIIGIIFYELYNEKSWFKNFSKDLFLPLSS